MSSYPTLRTWVTGEIVTAAMLNANVRDSIGFFKNPPLAVMRQTATQTLPTATWTDILQDVEDVDQDPSGLGGGHSTTTNTMRYTSHVDGWYLVMGGVAYAANVTGYRGARLQVNNSGIYRLQDEMAITQVGIGTVCTGSRLIYLGFGDFVELQGRQDSGGNLDTQIVENSPFLAVLAVSAP